MRFYLLTLLLLLSFSTFSQQFYLFVGTYTEGSPASRGSKGIYVYRFDAATGDATPVSTIMTDNPSYLAVAPGGKFLYSVNETHGAGTEPGGVSAFSFDKTSGKLTFIDKQTSGGADPCYISVDAGRKWALVANYSGGNLSALPIGSGRLASSHYRIDPAYRHRPRQGPPGKSPRPFDHPFTRSAIPGRRRPRNGPALRTATSLPQR